MPLRRLFPPQCVSRESREVVRKREIPVRTVDEVSEVVAMLQREKFVGYARVNFGPGGALQSIEAEERARLPA